MKIFAGDLYRMYVRYAETQGWKIQVLEMSESEAGGFSMISFLVKGDEVYRQLKFESGAHRVQRVPKTETQGRIHTSTATVLVLPDAEVKVFLCADVETRARRRFLELEQRGTPKPFDEVLRDMEQRDYNDTHRAAAPLRPADDAIMIDNTDMDFAASLELLLDVIRGRVAS